MKFKLSLLSLFFISTAYCQKIPTIIIPAFVISSDSVSIPFTASYDLAEDNCTQIVRYAHYNTNAGLYHGAFIDVSKADPSVVIAKGNYAENGLKDGKFLIYYIDGKLNAEGYYKQDKYDGEWSFYNKNGSLEIKGHFKDGQYTGKCALYNEDGRLLLTFDEEDGHCQIIDAWKKDGTRTVNNGTGYFTGDESSSTHWQGKITNGKPDSVWTCKQDIAGSTAFLTEYFNAGIFQNGHVELGNFLRDYTDASNINLTPSSPILIINRADNPRYSGYSCTGIRYPECFYMFLGKKIHLLTFKAQINKN
jgi:hypothetical protein